MNYDLRNLLSMEPITAKCLGKMGYSSRISAYTMTVLL